MSRASIEEVLERAKRDPEFKFEMGFNADATMHRTGLEFEWEEFRALRTLNWKGPIEAIEPQVRAIAEEAERRAAAGAGAGGPGGPGPGGPPGGRAPGAGGPPR